MNESTNNTLTIYDLADGVQRLIQAKKDSSPIEKARIEFEERQKTVDYGKIYEQVNS